MWQLHWYLHMLLCLLVPTVTAGDVVLWPLEQAIMAGFSELHRKYGIHANVSAYAIDNPWLADDDSPLALAVDSIGEAGMVPGRSLDLYHDSAVCARLGCRNLVV